MINESIHENTAEAKTTFQSQNDAAADSANEITVEVYDEMGVIGPGNIRTKGHITVLGNVIIQRNVKGKIICDNLLLENSKLEADIEAKGQVSIKGGITVKGQISCKSISVMGTVLGDIKADEKIGLADTAVIRGDISAKGLGTAPGAKIEGKVSIG